MTTAMKTEHTPLPWILSANGKIVNTAHKENMEFIIRAVNSLEAMKEVITELLRLYDLRNDLAAKRKSGEQKESEQVGALIRYGREKKLAWDEARAALKLAKGE